MRLKSLSATFYYQFLSSLRSWQSIFFTIFLTPILLVVFGYAFNMNSEYIQFFLPGMIAATLCSDALYAVGPVIKSYYQTGVIKYFKNYAPNITYLFFGFIATRLVFVISATTLLIALAYLLFGFKPSVQELGRYAIGSVLIFSIYSFIALSISFSGLKDNKDQNIISFYYLLTIFLTDCFFQLSKANTFFEIIGYVFPMKYILRFMRGENTYLIHSLLWLLLTYTVFYVLIHSKQPDRSL